MWCPKCKVKSPSVAVGTADLICAQCNSEIVQRVPKPKSKKVRKKADSSPQGTSVTSPRAEADQAEQTIASAQAVVNAWTQSHKKWRADKAHLIADPETCVDSESSAASNATETLQSGPMRASKGSGLNLILFGVFVYLVGHGLTIWAFLAGHFGAWVIGSFSSVGGVTIAIVSIVQALRDLQQKVERVQSISRPIVAEPSSTKRVRRVKRKRIRQT